MLSLIDAAEKSCKHVEAKGKPCEGELIVEALQAKAPHRGIVEGLLATGISALACHAMGVGMGKSFFEQACPLKIGCREGRKLR
jgi:hypothetical protein